MEIIIKNQKNNKEKMNGVKKIKYKSTSNLQRLKLRIIPKIIILIDLAMKKAIYSKNILLKFFNGKIK
jgi:hypothetical protein